MSSTTNTTAPNSDPQIVDRAARKGLLNDLPSELRALHVDVLAHTLQSGIPVAPSALVVVLSAHIDTADSPMRFTAEHVQELLWFGLAEFCEDYHLQVPDGCQEALHALLSIAVATNSLDTASDSVGDVFAAFGQLAAC